MFGHDDFRNVLYTWDQADQRLMIARLERRQAHPAIAGNHSRDAVADEGGRRNRRQTTFIGSRLMALIDTVTAWRHSPSRSRRRPTLRNSSNRISTSSFARCDPMQK